MIYDKICPYCINDVASLGAITNYEQVYNALYHKRHPLGYSGVCAFSKENELKYTKVIKGKIISLGMQND